MMLNVISQEYCPVCLMWRKTFLLSKVVGLRKDYSTSSIYLKCVWGSGGVWVCTHAGTWQATFVFAVWFPVKLGPKRQKARLEVEKGTCCFWFCFLFLPVSWQKWCFILTTAVCPSWSQNSSWPTQRYWYQLAAALWRPSLRLLSPSCVDLSSEAPGIPAPADQF